MQVNSPEERLAILHVPFMEFNPRHHLRDQGGTAKGFVDNGISTKLLIGKMKENTGAVEFDIVETGNTEINSISNHFSETIAFVRELIRDRPNVILVWNVGFIPSIEGVLLKLLSPILGLKTKSILRLDWDGEVRTQGRIRKLLFFANLKIASTMFDWITVETSCAIEKVSKMICKPNRLKLVPVGIYPSYSNKTINKEVREKIVLCVARIAEYKNIMGSLKVFNEVNREFPSWKFIQIGMVQDKDYFQKLVDYTTTAGLASKVKFEGELEYEAIEDWMARASVFITLSDAESFNLARYEAMSAGLKVISSPAGCAKDFPGIEVVHDISDAADALRRSLAEFERNHMKLSFEYSKVNTWDDIAVMFLSLNR